MSDVISIIKADCARKQSELKNRLAAAVGVNYADWREFTLEQCEQEGEVCAFLFEEMREIFRALEREGIPVKEYAAQRFGTH